MTFIFIFLYLSNDPATGLFSKLGGDPLYCCNQRADNVTAFRVNRKTGGLSFTGHYAAVGNPSHIVFLDLAKGS